MTEAYRIRASSFAGLFDCAYRWEGEHLLGLRLPSSPRAVLGRAWHAGTAAFDTARMQGCPISADDAAEALVREVREPEDDVDWTGGDLRPRDVERIALGLHSLYCRTISPQFEFEAVELTVKPLDIDCGAGIVVRLTGTLDRARIARRAGEVKERRIQDLKSGRAAVQKGAAKTKGFRAQVGTYELLAEHTTDHAMTAPAQIIGGKTEGKPEIALGEIPRAKELLIGTADEPGLIERGASMFRAGLFHPNPQSTLCNPKFCARWRTCIYHD